MSYGIDFKQVAPGALRAMYGLERYLNDPGWNHPCASS